MTIEKKFWNKKYEDGGISGLGSIGKYRSWKWVRIKEVIGDFKSVIDMGCGDLRFWEHPIANKMVKNQEDFKYLGIDISDFIIEKNKVFAPKFEFICAPSNVAQGRQAEVILCLDLLFHIMDDVNFEMTLEHLCSSSENWIVIYTWTRNPFEHQYRFTDGKSQYFRKLGKYKYIFDGHGFRLYQSFEVPYDNFGRLYFFKREIR